MVIPVLVGLLVTYISDAITITDFTLGLIDQQGSRGDIDDPQPTTNSSQLTTPEPQQPSPTIVEPTATPAPVKPLIGQLRLARSIKDPRLRDDALLKVVRQAIIHEDYWTATDVATTTSTTGKQARGLYFVVKCAIEDRQYRLAEEAANRIKAANYHDCKRRR